MNAPHRPTRESPDRCARQALEEPSGLLAGCKSMRLAALHSYPGQVWVLDPEGRILRFDEAARRFAPENGLPLPADGSEDGVERAQERAQCHRALAMGVMDLSDQATTSAEMARRVVDLLRDGLGVDAAGIRVSRGDALPYLAAVGFGDGPGSGDPDASDPRHDPEPRSGGAGDPSLDRAFAQCLGDPATLPPLRMSPGGSAWTADALADPDIPANEGPRAPVRHGSIAFVPLRAQGRFLGMLELGDRAPGRFSPEDVAFFEGLARVLGLALLRRQTEERLRTSLEQLRLAHAAARAGTWVWDVRSGANSWSDELYRLYGLEPGSCPATYESWRDRLHPEDREAAERYLAEAVAAHADLEFEWRVIHPDGNIHWILSRAHALTEPDGQISRYLGFAMDITARKSAEEAQRAMAAQLHQSQKMESMGSLAGGVAHDLNNVLAAVLGLASALEAGTMPVASRVRAVDSIIKACTRGREVVRSLLVFARRDLEEERPVDLDALVRELVTLLAHTTLKRASIELDLPDPLPRVLGDASTLSNVLMNLCLNSMDAMPCGGTLCITAGLEPDGALHVQVRDTGGGMPPDVLAKATDPFFTTKPTGKGTGLGLAMAYGTMKAHDGALLLKSEVGVGTEVTLVFPAARVLDEAPDPPEPEPEPQGQPASRALRILLVDDDDLIRDSGTLMFQVLGHGVTTASGGQEALDLLHGGLEIDLVILDMNMPMMGGGETLPRIRSLRPSLPVVIATGYEDSRVEALKARNPGLRVISKPYTLPEIRALLDEVTARTP